MKWTTMVLVLMKAKAAIAAAPVPYEYPESTPTSKCDLIQQRRDSTLILEDS
jgi:hypothetical protein